MEESVSVNISSENKFSRHMLIGFIIRIALVLWSDFHDSVFELKYTDIDYDVYTDAARYIVNGDSPYDRDTYRYTPIVALMMTPNILLHPAFGKIIFVVFDILTCWIMNKIVFASTRNTRLSCLSSLLWIYNPLPIGICTRGSSESIIVFLALTTLYFLKLGCYIKAGIIHGFAVHFKIYPVVYSPLLFLALGTGNFRISLRQMQLVLSSSFTFFLMTGLCYCSYGWKFLDETYFYHIYRQDFKHNFSVFWYFLYLNEGGDNFLLGYLPFLAQVLSIGVFSYKYRSLDSLEFGVFAAIFSFVTFNKVVTSQYFLWYLSLLPLIWFKFDVTPRKAIALASMWYASQGAFLLPAYLLEFRGMSVHVWVFLGCLIFFVCNCTILVIMVRSFDRSKKQKVV